MIQDNCKFCGERVVGDGYSLVRHCPWVEVDHMHLEPDADPVYCEEIPDAET